MTSESLDQALQRLDLALPQSQVDQLAAYARQLWEWNARLNLTRHTDWDLFAARDVLDAWELAGLLREGEAVLDVGSGGGAPGVLLKLLRPDLQVDLCESVKKKAAALSQIVDAVDVPATVHPLRVEQVLETHAFDTLTARAVGPLWKVLHWLDPHWEAFGRLLAVKGPRWVDERSEARHRGYLKKLQLRKAAEYSMPGTSSTSVILKVWPRDRAEP